MRRGGASEAANTPALFDRARALGVTIVTDLEAAQPEASLQLQRFIEASSAVYLTFCLDVLPPAVAPGVSAPAGLGVALHRVVTLLKDALAACGHGRPGSKLLLADIAELNPRFDSDGRTARTAARLVYELAAIHR